MPESLINALPARNLKAPNIEAKQCNLAENKQVHSVSS